MALVLLLTLVLCCGTAAGRSFWTNKPGLILSSREINDGESLDVSCLAPIDYRGGDCRLFRGRSRVPFRLITATDYVCDFHLSSQELLGRRPVGSKVFLRCDYKLQNYISVSSDDLGVTVLGTRPSPSLSISRHFISPDDSVEMVCTLPTAEVSWCSFHADEFSYGRGSCRRNLAGRELTVQEKPSLLLPLQLSCTYDPVGGLSIRSQPSDLQLLFVVDASRVTLPVHCRVSVHGDQLEALKDSSWTTAGTYGTTVTVQVADRNLTPEHTCSRRRSQNDRGTDAQPDPGSDLQPADVRSSW